MENNISYILTADEVKEALLTAGVIKPYKKKMIVVLIISVILLVLHFRPLDFSTYPMSVVLIFANLFAFFGYKRNEQNIIRSSTTGALTELYAYDEHINVIVKEYDADWNIFKDDVLSVKETDEQIVIILVDGRLMAVPKRVLNDNNKPSFEKVLNYFSPIDNQNKELGE